MKKHFILYISLITYILNWVFFILCVEFRTSNHYTVYMYSSMIFFILTIIISIIGACIIGFSKNKTDKDTLALILLSSLIGICLISSFIYIFVLLLAPFAT